MLDTSYIENIIEDDSEVKELRTALKDELKRANWNIALIPQVNLNNKKYTDIDVTDKDLVLEFIIDLMSEVQDADNDMVIQNTRYFYLLLNTILLIKRNIIDNCALSYNRTFLAFRRSLLDNQKLTIKIVQDRPSISFVFRLEDADPFGHDNKYVNLEIKQDFYYALEYNEQVTIEVYNSLKAEFGYASVDNITFELINELISKIDPRP